MKMGRRENSEKNSDLVHHKFHPAGTGTRSMMWRLCFRLIVVLAMCCSLSESQSDVYQFMDKRHNRRYCGRNLVEMLQLVCNGSYNGMSTTNTNHKKSIQEMDEDFWPPAEEVYKFPFRSRSSAHRIYKRYPSGIAYECCISKGCSVLELRSYCAPITS